MKSKLGTIIMLFLFTLLFSASHITAQTLVQEGPKFISSKGKTYQVTTAPANETAGALNTSLTSTPQKSIDMESWALQVGARPISVGGKTYYQLVDRNNEPGLPVPKQEGLVEECPSKPVRKQ